MVNFPVITPVDYSLMNRRCIYSEIPYLVKNVEYINCMGASLYMCAIYWSFAYRNINKGNYPLFDPNNITKYWNDLWQDVTLTLSHTGNNTDARYTKRFSVMRNFNFRVDRYSGQTMDVMKSLLKEGVPIILDVHANKLYNINISGNLHSILLVGLDEENRKIFYLDPESYNNEPGEVREDRLNEAWQIDFNLYLPLPKGVTKVSNKKNELLIYAPLDDFFSKNDNIGGEKN